MEYGCRIKSVTRKEFLLWAWLRNGWKYQASKGLNGPKWCWERIGQSVTKEGTKTASETMYLQTNNWWHKQPTKNKVVWYVSLIPITVCTYKQEKCRRCGSPTAALTHEIQEDWLMTVWYLESYAPKVTAIDLFPLYQFTWLCYFPIRWITAWFGII